MKKHTGIYWYGGALVCFLVLIGYVFSAYQKREVVTHQIMPSTSSIVENVSLSSNALSMDRSAIETTGFVSPNVPTVTWHEWSQVSRSKCGNVQAALVNHHILASDLLGRSFSWLQFCRPDVQRVIILSPDHFLRGHTFISTHVRPYLASGNRIDSAIPLITEATTTLSFIQEEPELFTHEHGVGALIPFVARAWPRASIASFAIRSDLPKEDAARFVKLLKTTLDGKTLLIVSSDMSHYLTRHQALTNDEKTRQALRTKDTEFFWRANDDFTDNGKGIWMTLQSIGTSFQWNEQSHQISSDYDGSSNNTTSYLTGWWAQK